jgi:hypothetical protein
MCFKLSKSYRNTATNVGLDLYQQLFKNASETHQPEYAADADIFRRRWRRWQLIWELKKEKKFRLPQFFNIASNWLYDLVAVYGYGPGRFAFVSAVIFCLLAKVIQITWPYLGMSFQKNELKVEWLSPCLSAAGAQTAWQQISFTDALYNLLLLMTTLGADGVVPTTGIGKLFVIGSALFGMSWFSLFTAILVRRVIR